MCGLFATTRPEVWRPLVPKVLALLDHRGPDASGCWESPDGLALLAHTRLAIIGLEEAGAQPAISADSGLALTFNGEIYNYRQLGAALGHPAARSDTAVLADLLAKEGPGAAQRLRGMWAFAGWDRRSRTLIAGRDPWGIKPLYLLHHPDGGVSLCSEIPPLLLCTDARRLDPVGLAQYLAFGHSGPNVTIFEPIRKIAPGTVVEWRLDDGTTTTRSIHLSPPDIELDDLGAAVDDSVLAHLVADVEVGVFLSGGIDSTLIAASARSQVERLRTYTISFPEAADIDESSISEHNARLLGTLHRTVPVRTDEMVAAAERFVRVHGEPFGDAAALPLTVLASTVGKDLKVVLVGEGSDELFGGYGRYRISRRLGGAMTLARPASAGVARWLGERRGDAPRWRALEALAWAGGADSYAALLGSDLTTMKLNQVAHADDVDALLRADWDASHNGDDAEEETARRFDQHRWLPNTYLEKTDRATMAGSLEGRVPYLDGAVARCAGRMPVDPAKRALRKELHRRLPGVVLPSRKKGLAVNLGLLLEHGLDSHLAYELGSAGSVLNRLLGAQSVETFRRRAARSDLTAFRLAMLGVWEETVEAAACS